MGYIVLEPVVQFEEGCEKIAASWQKFSFTNPYFKETPSQHFGRIGSVESVKQAYKESQQMNQPWMHIATGVAGTALGVFAVASGLGVIGLGMAAAFAGGSTYTFLRSKKQDEILKSDLALAEKIFPKMQNDLDKILGRGIELALSANQAFQNNELSDQQRRTSIREIHKIIREFSADELGIDEDVLENGKFKIKHPHNSKDIRDQVIGALAKLENLHDDPGTRLIKPYGKGLQRGVERDDLNNPTKGIDHEDIDPLGR